RGAGVHRVRAWLRVLGKTVRRIRLFPSCTQHRERSAGSRSGAPRAEGLQEGQALSTPVEILEAWCDYMRAVQGRRPSTVERYRRAVAGMLECAGVGTTAEFTFEAAENYLK